MLSIEWVAGDTSLIVGAPSGIACFRQQNDDGRQKAAGARDLHLG